MNDFLMILIFLGVLFVPMALMFLICGATTKSKIGGAIFSIVIWLMFSAAVFSEAKYDDEMWNNGICSTCGSDYIFNGASHYRTSDNYYYTCKDCGHTIEINSFME